MRKTFALILAATLTVANFAYFGATPALAQGTQIAAGKPLFGADGKRLGTIYRLAADGSPQLIIDGKMVTVPVASVSQAEGKVQTSLNRKDLRLSR